MAVDIGAKTDVSVILRSNMNWQHRSNGAVSCWCLGHADSGGLAEYFLDKPFAPLESPTPHRNGRVKATSFLTGFAGIQHFCASVRQLKGNFAVIVRYKDTFFACVDRIRSYPLFYSAKGGAFFISDDARLLSEKTGYRAMDNDAADEFYMSGYVSGRDTLVSGIKQIQPGEAVCFEQGKGAGTDGVATMRYYLFYEQKKTALSPDDMIELYDKTMLSAFRRILEGINGRRIVVPLSGGRDSRSIIFALKRIGYDNVTCLFYGTKKSWERPISEEAAKRLRFDWLPVEYTRRQWHDMYRSKEWNDFFYSYDNLSSLPNIDEWCALSVLKKDKKVPDDAVFMPGHTGDFITGGHLHHILDGEMSKDSLISSILAKHYGLWRKELKNARLRQNISGKIARFIQELHIDSWREQDMADAYECWEWHERQSKFVINAVRNYDFRGYEWRLPLWDGDIMDFWSSVPIALKKGRRLYYSYLAAKDTYGLFGSSLIGRSLHKERFAKGYLRNFTEYFTEPKGVYGIYGFFTVSFLNMARRNINSLLVKDYIKHMMSAYSI